MKTFSQFLKSYGVYFALAIVVLGALVYVRNYSDLKGFFRQEAVFDSGVGLAFDSYVVPEDDVVEIVFSTVGASSSNAIEGFVIDIDNLKGSGVSDIQFEETEEIEDLKFQTQDNTDEKVSIASAAYKNAITEDIEIFRLQFTVDEDFTSKVLEVSGEIKVEGVSEGETFQDKFITVRREFDDILEGEVTVEDDVVVIDIIASDLQDSIAGYKLELSDIPSFLETNSDDDKISADFPSKWNGVYNFTDGVFLIAAGSGDNSLSEGDSLCTITIEKKSGSTIADASMKLVGKLSYEDSSSAYTKPVILEIGDGGSSDPGDDDYVAEDININGYVNFRDFSCLLGSWKQDYEDPDAGLPVRADINKDVSVNLLDFNLLVDAYEKDSEQGEGCGPLTGE